jgi:HSP20 family protein
VLCTFVPGVYCRREGVAYASKPKARSTKNKAQRTIFNLKSPPLAIANQFPYSFGMPHSKSHFSVVLGPRATPSGRLWNPSADVYRSSEGWIVKLDLAGVCSNDLEIELRDSLLTIRGCRKDTHYSEGFIYHQMEITYSRFEKQIQFPDRVEGASVAQDYNDGFFIIKLRSEDSSN